MPFEMSSTAVATATATAQSNGGLATSVSVASSIGNATSVSTTNATSVGNGTSLAVGIANATSGQASITHSHALSTGEMLVSVMGGLAFSSMPFFHQYLIISSPYLGQSCSSLTAGQPNPC
jgi:hypothetical protein